MFISQPLIGWGCLALAIVLTLFFPLGRQSASHTISSLAIIVLFVIAAYNLITVEMIPETWKVIAIGLGAGVIAVVIRDVFRFFRFFHGKIYRVTHPYYWYSRAFRSLASRRRSR
jgi:hypothetical protein